jgi:hypothetical protein
MHDDVTTTTRRERVRERQEKYDSRSFIPVYFNKIVKPIRCEQRPRGALLNGRDCTYSKPLTPGGPGLIIRCMAAEAIRGNGNVTIEVYWN